MSKTKFTRRHLWAIMEAAGMDHGKAVALTNQAITALATAIAAGRVIELRGFGSFELRERKAYKARNRGGGKCSRPAYCVLQAVRIIKGRCKSGGSRA
jgi:nucleoid DNA-binding protein